MLDYISLYVWFIVNGCEIETKPISDIENISVEEEYSWIISQTENTR